jgi:PRTRC genetic system protein D
MKKIGVDVGFGYAKVVWFEGDVARQLVIPSVLGRAAQVQQMDLSGLGGRKRHRTFNVTYEGEEYFVGSDALLHSATGVQATQTFGRIGSDEERILLLALLARAGLDDVAIVTGLPVLAWDLRHKLRRSWTGQHQIVLGRKEMTVNVREVRTAWQPVLSLYDYSLTFDGDQVRLTNGMNGDLLRRGWLVVDPGHNTTDRAGVINLTPVDRYTGGSRVGGRDILAVLNKRLEQEYGISRPIAELEEALRRGWLDVFSDRVDLLPLARSAAASLSAQIASDVSGAIGDGSMFYGILVTGGPADVVRPAIAQACPRNTVTALHDSQIANARGAATWGQGPGVFKCLS